MTLRSGAPNDIRAALREAQDEALRIRRDSAGIVGYGIAHLMDGDGHTLTVQPFANLITDTGDSYYASKAIAGISPANPGAPTAVTGMQIGSGSTAVSKAGAGAAMVTLLAGQAFDSGYPQINNLGSGNGVQAVFKATYAAGTGNGTVQEATITNGTISVSSIASNTISRVVFSSIVKNNTDSLAITWQHLFRG